MLKSLGELHKTLKSAVLVSAPLQAMHIIYIFIIFQLANERLGKVTGPYKLDNKKP